MRCTTRDTKAMCVTGLYYIHYTRIMARLVLDNHLIVGQIDDLFCRNDLDYRPRYEILSYEFVGLFSVNKSLDIYHKSYIGFYIQNSALTT